jgi:hypothetical protein
MDYKKQISAPVMPFWLFAAFESYRFFKSQSHLDHVIAQVKSRRNYLGAL